MTDENKKKAGRPRLEDPNANYNPTVVGVLSDTALGLSKLPDGKYAIVKIKYNPLTGGTGTPELKIVNENLNSSEYEFRDVIDQYLDEIGNK